MCFEDSLDLAVFVDRLSVFVRSRVSPQSDGLSAYATSEIILGTADRNSDHRRTDMRWCLRLRRILT